MIGLGCLWLSVPEDEGCSNTLAWGAAIGKTGQPQVLITQDWGAATFSSSGSTFFKQKSYPTMQNVFKESYFFLERQEVHETFLWGNSLTTTILGISRAVLWLRILAFIAGGMGSIPGQGAKIPYAMRYSQKNKKWKTERKRKTIILDVIRWAWSSNGLWSYTVLRTECFQAS